MVAVAALVMSCATAVAQIDRIEVGASYGFAPATGIIKKMSEISIDELSTDEFKNADKLGAVSANVNFRLTKGFGVGLIYSYSTLKQDINAHLSAAAPVTPCEQTYKYHSIMPQIKFSWVNTRLITIYTRLAGGITIISTERMTTELADKKTWTDSKKYAAFQISPIGVELGNNLALFLEGGFGTMGILQGGVRLRL